MQLTPLENVTVPYFMFVLNFSGYTLDVFIEFGQFCFRLLQSCW